MKNRNAKFVSLKLISSKQHFFEILFLIIFNDRRVKTQIDFLQSLLNKFAFFHKTFYY